ncbi:serine O-acetyltransferase [Verrucomicrobium spinosum]|uniref:serine O-acetyltransferase n=1 Tax=Verrucomicrobium spinosum TaxID=2736 RepID=UPI00017453BF|nr:serine O-acetyltransferase [Verrucomicrobium spinosum]
MFETLAQDITRNLADYQPKSRWKGWLLTLTLNSTQAVTLIRLQFWMARHGLPTLPVAKILFWMFKIEVSRHAYIGPGLRLPHPMGIIIGPWSHVGANCDLYADVRLVLAHGVRQGPSLGDGVFMGDGAKAVGPVRIGKGTVVGVSAVVTRDLPEGVTAAGIPARILGKNQQAELS